MAYSHPALESPCQGKQEQSMHGSGPLEFQTDTTLTCILARGRCTLVPADAHYFCIDEVTPGARLVHVDQHLPTVVVAYTGYDGRLALQGRHELSGMIELVEHVLARRLVCAQTAYGASLIELGIKVVQIRNCFAQ